MDCRVVFNTREGDRITSKDLDQALRLLEDRPWDTMGSGKGLTAQTRGRWLNTFGINSIQLHPENAKGYERAAFENAWTSYGEPNRPNEPNGPGSTTFGSFGSSRGDGGTVHPEPSWVMKGDGTMPRDPLHTSCIHLFFFVSNIKLHRRPLDTPAVPGASLRTSPSTDESGHRANWEDGDTASTPAETTNASAASRCSPSTSGHSRCARPLHPAATASRSPMH